MMLQPVTLFISPFQSLNHILLLKDLNSYGFWTVSAFMSVWLISEILTHRIPYVWIICTFSFKLLVNVATVIESSCKSDSDFDFLIFDKSFRNIKTFYYNFSQFLSNFNIFLGICNPTYSKINWSSSLSSFYRHPRLE